MRTRYGLLATALLVTELLAGIQTFLTATVTPLLAADLGGRHLYGVVTAASQVAVFLTMPLGAGLMRRFTPGQLLAWLTPVTVVAGILGAVSPGMWFYIGTRVLAGLAAGAIATVSMGAVVTGLPARWRQLVLAANNLMWLVAAVVGPVYAAWATAALSWRWALVLYLPLLLAARVVIARELGRQPRPEPQEARLPVAMAVLLAAGLGLVAALSLGGAVGLAAGAVGTVLVLVALVRLLPRGVVTMSPGARSGIALLGILSPMLFAADVIVPILGHDVLGLTAFRLGALIAVLSVTWSAVGLACARWPATGAAFRRRGGLGIGLLALGLVTMALAVAGGSPGWMIAGNAVTGTGMGLTYLDAMNVAFTPDPVEPLEPTAAASAAVLAEQVLGALAMTMTTSAVAFRPGLGVWCFVALTLLGVPALVALWRATSSPATAWPRGGAPRSSPAG